MCIRGVLFLYLATVPALLLAAQQSTVEHFVGAEGGIGSRDGRGPTARFNQPRGVWSDGTFAYVVDQGNSTIRKIELATGDVSTFAGTAQQPQPGLISTPSTVWGNGAFLYFIDGVVIRRVSIATGEIAAFAGSTTGTTDGVGEQAQFRGPLAITGNSTDIFILDSPLFVRYPIWSSPALIRKISLSTGEVRTLPLPPVTPGGPVYDVDPSALWADDQSLYLTFVSRPGSVALGQMSVRTFEFTPLFGFPLPPADSRYLPRHLWSDGAGNFFFTDGTKIYRFVLSTGEISLVATAPPASGNSIGGLSGAGNMLVATDQAANIVFQVNTATNDVATVAGLAYTAPSRDEDIRPLAGAGAFWHQGQFFYVIDRNRSVIHRIAADTGELSTFVPSIHLPSGIWGDEKFLYVTQSMDGIVSKISLETGAVSTIGTALVNPYAIAGDSTDLYVSDRDVINRISKADGTSTPLNSLMYAFRAIVSLWIDGSTLYVLDGNALWKVNLSTLQYSAIAGVPYGSINLPGQPVFSSVSSTIWSDGKFIYAGVGGGIQRLDPGTNELKTIVGSPQLPGFQDGLPGIARIGVPQGIWSDGQYIYFVDNSLRRFNLTTQEVTTWVGLVLRLSEGKVPPEQFGAIAVTGGNGFLYAASGYAIYKISLATREITHLAGAFNERGTKDGTGSEARFADPVAMFNMERYIFIADSGMSAVRRVDVDTGEVTTIATGIALPVGIWANGNYLYVSHLVDNPTMAGIDRIDLRTREVVPFAIGLLRAKNIWGDAANLYVSGYDCTIRKVSLSTAVVSLLAGNPDCNPRVLRDGAGSEARFLSPNSIWSDGRLLFITDSRTLRTVHPVTGETHTIAGDPLKDGTENGIGLDARFDTYLNAIWGDGTYLYIADRAIRRVTLPPPVMNTVHFEIRSGGGNYWKSSATTEPLQIAYARLQPTTLSATPDGIVVFSSRVQGTLVSEVSIPAAPLMQSGRLYAEMNATVRTGIAIVNPNETSATISFYFTNAAGTHFGNGTTIISANKQIAVFLNEAPFNGTSDAQSFTFTASVPVAAIALRGYVNERSDFLMTALPVAPLSSTGASPVVLPHYASGGGWTTQILLVNPTDETIRGTVEMDTTTSYLIPPRSATKVVGSNTGSQIRTGVVRIIPAQGSLAAVASSVFSFFLNGVTVTETGIVTTGASQSFHLFAEFDSTQSERTGVAIANLATTAIAVQFELLTMDGQPTGVTGSSTVAASGHLSLFLDELPGFQNLPTTVRGVLRISSATPISAIGLRGRYNERGDFLISTTPALADNGAAVAGELVFPHIVTGGGYTTEFLLLSRGSASTGSISIHSQSGTELSLPLTN
jgi:hypothetical protein